MYMLLGIHSLQVIFLRKLYTKDHRVNKEHMWVWVVHGIVLPYILYKYWQTMIDSYVNVNEIYESRKIWVPMDCILTFSVGCYYLVAILNDKDKTSSPEYKISVDNDMAKEGLLKNFTSEQEALDNDNSFHPTPC